MSVGSHPGSLPIVHVAPGGLALWWRRGGECYGMELGRLNFHSALSTGLYQDLAKTAFFKPKISINNYITY